MAIPKKLQALEEVVDRAEPSENPLGIVGKSVTGIFFCRDRIEVHFGGRTLAGAAFPEVELELGLEAMRFRSAEALCALIGCTVDSVSLRQGGETAVGFQSERRLLILAAQSHGLGPVPAEIPPSRRPKKTFATIQGL